MDDVASAHVAIRPSWLAARDRVAGGCRRGGERGHCLQLDILAAESRDQDDAARIRSWAAWARQEADRVDPLGHPCGLFYQVPEEISASDLDKFMPRGMNAWHPPD